MSTALVDRYREIRRRISEAADRAGRDPENVLLLAVSKLHPAAQMVELLEAGHTEFGENYVQEAKGKLDELSRNPITSRASLHLIGNLQRNKSKDAVAVFDVIQSVDRPELVEALAVQAAKAEKCQRILLQVKVAAEETKSGVAPSAAADLLSVCAQYRTIAVEGLMCIGRFSDSGVPEAERREEFRLLTGLRDALQDKSGKPLPQLSMGMSEDFEIAVAEGSTIVRVGTALFGPRESLA